MSLDFGNAPPPLVPSSYMRAVPQCATTDCRPNQYTKPFIANPQRFKVSYAVQNPPLLRRYNNPRVVSKRPAVVKKNTTRKMTKRRPQVRKVKKIVRRCRCPQQARYKCRGRPRVGAGRRKTTRAAPKRRVYTPRRKRCA